MMSKYLGQKRNGNCKTVEPESGNQRQKLPSLQNVPAGHSSGLCFNLCRSAGRSWASLAVIGTKKLCGNKAGTAFSGFRVSPSQGPHPSLQLLRSHDPKPFPTSNCTVLVSVHASVCFLQLLTSQKLELFLSFILSCLKKSLYVPTQSTQCKLEESLEKYIVPTRNSMHPLVHCLVSCVTS